MDNDTETEYPESFLDVIATQIFEDDLNILLGFNNKHYDYHVELILRTDFLPHYAPIKERFWHLYHKTEDKPLCARVGCTKQVTWHLVYSRLNRFCGKSCGKSDYWDRKRLENEKNSNNE